MLTLCKRRLIDAILDSMAKINPINLDVLRAEIRKMTRNSQIYYVLKDELKARGYWRRLPRGNPQGFSATNSNNLMSAASKRVPIK